MRDKPADYDSGDWEGYYKDLFVYYGGSRASATNRFQQINRLYKAIDSLPDTSEKELLYTAAKLERTAATNDSITLTDCQKDVVGLFLKMVHRRRVQDLWERKKAERKNGNS